MSNLEQSLQEALTGLSALRDRADSLQTQVDSHTRTYELDQVELESLRGQLVQLKAERDFYQRFTVELTTNLNGVQMLVDDCMQKAKDAAYRPDGPRAKPNMSKLRKRLVKLDDGEPVPKFLTGAQ